MPVQKRALNKTSEGSSSQLTSEQDEIILKLNLGVEIILMKISWMRRMRRRNIIISMLWWMRKRKANLMMLKRNKQLRQRL